MNESGVYELDAEFDSEGAPSMLCIGLMALLAVSVKRSVISTEGTADAEKHARSFTAHVSISMHYAV